MKRQATKDIIAALPAGSSSEARRPPFRRARAERRHGRRREQRAGPMRASSPDVSVLGPFRRHRRRARRWSGEAKKDRAAAFGDPTAPYSWGSGRVAWRPVPNTYSRRRAASRSTSSCIRGRRAAALVADRRITPPEQDLPVIVRLAAAQAPLRLSVRRRRRRQERRRPTTLMRFDRLAAKVEASAGPHIVAAKICTGALEDSGRVRLRVGPTQAQNQHA